MTMKKTDEKTVLQDSIPETSQQQNSDEKTALQELAPESASKKASLPPPAWNLTDNFFSSIDDPQIAETKKKILAYVKYLCDQKEHLPKMLAHELLEFVSCYESFIIDARHLSNFATLNLCTQRDNKEAELFEKNIGDFLEQCSNKLKWIHHSLYELPLEKKYEFLSSKKLKHYEEWLTYQLAYRPALSEAIEKAVNKMSGLSEGWHSLYKEMTSKLTFVMGKKTYTLDEITNIAYSDKDKSKRDKALKIMSDEFKKRGYIFAQTLNSIYKTEDTLTKVYYTGQDDRVHLLVDSLDLEAFANGLSREDVLSVASAVTDSYAPVSQRFYKLLAKLQGVEKLCYNDRLINPIEVKRKKIPWESCVNIVVGTLLKFNPALAAIYLPVINENLVHALPQKGKDTGAFCIRGPKPYIFLNYREDFDSVTTFAHESGHAVHHIVSHENAGILNDSTTIALSEIASEFNEKLVFNEFLSVPELSNKDRLNLLIDSVNRQIATIHRQIAFSKFELRVYRERQKGELSEDTITQIYTEEMERYLGFPLDDDAKFGWMAIPHIFNSPFYVRHYAFAGLVVNKLWQIYTQQSIDNFADLYANMLANTGIEDIDALFEPFELDITTPDFWSSAIDPISAEIDEIERLAKIEGLI